MDVLMVPTFNLKPEVADDNIKIYHQSEPSEKASIAMHNDYLIDNNSISKKVFTFNGSDSGGSVKINLDEIVIKNNVTSMYISFTNSKKTKDENKMAELIKRMLNIFTNQWVGLFIAMFVLIFGFISSANLVLCVVASLIFLTPFLFKGIYQGDRNGSR